MDDLKNNGSYVVLSKSDGIVYKRIAKDKEKKNKLTLISDNPVYESYSVSEEDVLELWKAVYILQKANTIQRWDVNQLASMVNNLQEEVVSLKKKLA